MGSEKLTVGIVFVALLAGSFAVGYGFLRTGPSAAPTEAPPPPAAQENVVAEAPAPENKEEPRTPPPAERRPASKPKEPKPLSCAEASELGVSCVGERVSWVGKWIHSQSATIGKDKGAQYIFETRGPRGEFSFDHPFIAEDLNPLERLAKGQNVRDFFDKRWGPTRIVTVTGTIARLETLMFIGRGTRHDVPVLRNITITINR